MKIGPERTSGFFIVTGDVLRLGNADFQIGENADASKGGKTYSLRDASGRFLVCCTDAALSVTASPADDAQWFRIRFYTPAQKEEDRRRANSGSAGPGSSRQIKPLKESNVFLHTNGD